MVKIVALGQKGLLTSAKIEEKQNVKQGHNYTARTAESIDNDMVEVYDNVVEDNTEIEINEVDDGRIGIAKVDYNY